MRTAAWPLRVVVVLLLSGLGLWQAWQCSNGMAASPVAGMPAMTHHTPLMDVTLLAAQPPAQDEPMPAGLAGVCITVLASVAAAFVLLKSPLRLLALLRRLLAAMVQPVAFARPQLSLTQMCVSRT
ncbi:MAG TPA: hypothetical protein DGT23_13655 [Micromonosporaceae bacterium]|nr:hypothetical protein [Micromonosporaceae bacterium]